MDKQELPAHSQVLEPVRTGDDYSMDTKSHLQEHWIWYWIDKLFEREEENVQLKSRLHHLQLAQDTDQKCLEELREENMALKTAQGKSVEESAHLRWELEQLSEASSCFLKLDQEKQSLQGIIQGLQDASLALQESSLQRRELEEENQQLRKQIEDLRVQMEREKQTSQDLETLCEELVEEREQLLRDNKTLKAERAQEFKDMKKLVHSLRDSSQTSSKARMKGRKTEQKVLLQTVTDTKRKVTMMEWERRQLCQDLEQVKAQAAQAQELEHMKVRVKEQVVRAQKLEQELHRLQEEIEKLAMEVSTLTTAPERVHALEWESQDLLLENQRLQTSLDTLQPEGLERDKQLDTRQVENSTLRSQSASLTALTEQDTQLQHQQLVAAHQALQQEHVILGTLHEHLTTEHEALMDKYRRQKTTLRRTLELEMKRSKSTITLSDVELVQLETEQQKGPPSEKVGVFPINRYKDQLQHKAALEQLGTLLTTEREALQREQRTSAMAAEENQRLQGELDRNPSRAQCDWLRKEQEDLQICNNKLQTSLNEMQLEKNRWQAQYKGLKGEQEKLQTHSKKLQTSRKDTQLEVHYWQAQYEGLKGQQEELQMHSKKLQTSLSDTQLQVNCWQAQCNWLREEQEELQIYNNELQTSLNEMQLEKNRWQAQYKGMKGQQEELQMHSKKLQTSLRDTQLELLSRLKGNLEGENRHLQNQIQSLTEKNQRLHQEDVENNYQHQEEQRQYV
ncbi:protein Daple-like [Myotis yumanensis]|uniref:protein Daple-like n=1 Tax=Myotis yumanensis TaxID=159337 RepID=UPI0038D3719C